MRGKKHGRAYIEDGEGFPTDFLLKSSINNRKRNILSTIGIIVFTIISFILWYRYNQNEIEFIQSEFKVVRTSDSIDDFVNSIYEPQRLKKGNSVYIYFDRIGSRSLSCWDNQLYGTDCVRGDKGCIMNAIKTGTRIIKHSTCDTVWIKDADVWRWYLLNDY